MKTTAQSFTQKLIVWAIPKTHDLSLDEDPCYYECRQENDRPWSSGAINIMEHEVIVDVPEGIDFTAKAISTLEAAIEETQAIAQRQVNNLQTQLDAMLQIEHVPSA
jgi:hypothetical protein